MKAVFESSANGRVLGGNDGDGESGFVGLLKGFEHFAAGYEAEAGRPAVLVLDNINVLADKHPEVLDLLQDRAKTAADMGLYKVVLVCSDGAAPIRMEGKQ